MTDENRWTCAKCEAINEDNFRFCPRCGTERPAPAVSMTDEACITELVAAWYGRPVPAFHELSKDNQHDGRNLLSRARELLCPDAEARGRREAAIRAEVEREKLSSANWQRAYDKIGRERDDLRAKLAEAENELFEQAGELKDWQAESEKQKAEIAKLTEQRDEASRGRIKDGARIARLTCELEEARRELAEINPLHSLAKEVARRGDPPAQQPVVPLKRPDGISEEWWKHFQEVKERYPLLEGCSIAPLTGDGRAVIFGAIDPLTRANAVATPAPAPQPEAEVSTPAPACTCAELGKRGLNGAQLDGLCPYHHQAPAPAYVERELGATVPHHGRRSVTGYAQVRPV